MTSESEASAAEFSTVATTSVSTGSPDATRRSLLGLGMRGAILAGFAARLHAQGAAHAPPQTSVVRQPIGDLRFLVDRITNGRNDEVWARAQLLGYDAFLEEQLDPASIDDSAMDAELAAYPTLTMTSKQIYDTYVVPNQTNVPVIELKTATIMRGARSKRQLLERMVEFWSDHFSVDHLDGQVQWLKTTEDRTVIRVHALGNFRDLLRADAKSAAMLYYLDNYRNFASAPNENYAREVMELHTLGVGNFTELDVRELARCLTGWQYFPQSNPNHGNFAFNATQHDNGSKVVLGQVIAPAGVTEGETVLDMFAAHSATAHFVARKMCHWLLCYAPPQSIVDAVANVFLATGGDIKSMVRTILARSTVIQIAPSALVKIKRPFHLVASLLRTTNPSITQAQRLTNELKSMGHMPFAWQTPNGYPDTAEVWGASLLPRWSFLTRAIGNSIAGFSIDVATLFAGVPKSGLAARANQILMGGTMTTEDVAAVQAYADASPALNDALRRDVLALASSSPSFQVH